MEPGVIKNRVFPVPEKRTESPAKRRSEKLSLSVFPCKFCCLLPVHGFRIPYKKATGFLSLLNL
jgi:hypothetical protein